MFSKIGLGRDLSVGIAFAFGVGALGWLTTASALTSDSADAAIREFGTLLTVVFGIIAAMWWNQSAKIANRLADEDAPARQPQKDANALNGAAATFTAVALCCSVFAGSPWRSTVSWLSALGVLLLLSMSGGDIRQAIPISLRQRFELREILGLLSLAIVTLAFIGNLMK